MKSYREGTARGLEGVPLSFTVYGSGSPAIVCCNGVGVDTGFWKYIVRYFSQRHTVVTWDYRGHGRSATPAKITRDRFTIEANVKDLMSVMNAAGVKKAVLLGHSMGTQVILEAWRRHADRVIGLGMMCGAFGKPLDTFWNSKLSAPIFDAVYRFVNAAPKQFARGNRFFMRSPLPMFFARLGVVDPAMCRREDLQPYFDHLAILDPQIFYLMAGEAQRHTAITWLEDVDVPTLVVAGERDLFTPYHLSVKMRDEIPDAELLTVPNGSHVAFIEQPELVNLRLEKFLRDRVMTPGEAGADAREESAEEHRARRAPPKPRKRSPKKKAKAPEPEPSDAEQQRLRLVE